MNSIRARELHASRRLKHLTRSATNRGTGIDLESIQLAPRNTKFKSIASRLQVIPIHDLLTNIPIFCNNDLYSILKQPKINLKLPEIKEII